MNLNDWIFSEPFSDYPILDAVLLVMIMIAVALAVFVE